MKFGDALVNMVGDLATMHRTPDVHLRKLKDFDRRSSPSPTTTSATLPRSFGRRHSLNLTIGIPEGLPQFNNDHNNMRRGSSVDCLDGRQSHSSTASYVDSGRRQSEPILRVLNNSLHSKLQKLKNRSSLACMIESDESEELNRSRKSSKQTYVGIGAEMSKPFDDRTHDDSDNHHLRVDHGQHQRSASCPSEVIPRMTTASHRGSVICIDENETSIVDSSSLQSTTV
ncbi:hypothetical protein AB6A40_001468 [Gnathostoma spinigerum]|uniref:Uncharacterized protein n=1 Tax=Gnathostoma spinigerum TaxID=75299 RepID=A0ABD6E486_9BILA